MNKYEIVALYGAAGAGKDTIQRYLSETRDNVLNGIISCTTRPPRENEKDGVHYHFLTNEQFAEKVLDYSMLEATCFREWYYGTPIESLRNDRVNLGVFNIDGIECLLQDERLNVHPIFIWATDKQRLLRQLNREQNPDCNEIVRRFEADRRDFMEVPFEPALVYDNNADSFQTPSMRQLNALIDTLVIRVFGQ